MGGQQSKDQPEANEVSAKPDNANTTDLNFLREQRATQLHKRLEQ